MRRARLAFATVFAADPEAKETFTFVVQGNRLLVQHYNVNSEVLMQGLQDASGVGAAAE